MASEELLVESIRALHTDVAELRKAMDRGFTSVTDYQRQQNGRVGKLEGRVDVNESLREDDARRHDLRIKILGVMIGATGIGVTLAVKLL